MIKCAIQGKDKTCFENGRWYSYNYPSSLRNKAIKFWRHLVMNTDVRETRYYAGPEARSSRAVTTPDLKGQEQEPVSKSRMVRVTLQRSEIFCWGTQPVATHREEARKVNTQTILRSLPLISYQDASLTKHNWEPEDRAQEGNRKG